MADDEHRSSSRRLNESIRRGNAEEREQRGTNTRRRRSRSRSRSCSRRSSRRSRSGSPSRRRSRSRSRERDHDRSRRNCSQCDGHRRVAERSRRIAPNAFALKSILQSTNDSRDRMDREERELAEKKLAEINANAPRRF